MKTLILTTMLAAATLGFTRCVAAEGVVTAAKPTKSVLKSARPQYVARAQVNVPAERPSVATVEPESLLEHGYAGHGYAAPADPFAGTWWEGFWSERHHGQSCWGGGHGGCGADGGCGAHGARGGKHGGRCGKFSMGGLSLSKCGRCGRHSGGCNECRACEGNHAHQATPEQPEPELDSYFEPLDPPGLDAERSDIAPLDSPPMPEVPRRLSPPRNVLPKNEIKKAAPRVNSAAKNIDSAVTHHVVEQASSETVLRFRVTPETLPVMRQPKTETADLLFRQTVR